MSKTCDRCGKKLNERDRTTICLECEVALADEVNEELETENAALREKLAAANKRADAAIRDIKSMEVGEQTFPPDPCMICNKNHISCSTGGSACKGFEWRGERKGEEE